MAWRNHSTITEFILIGLSNDPHVEALLFVLFLGIYLLTMMGNLMMILVIRADSHLHTPMYFFLGNLSFMDLSFSSVTVPKLLKDLLSEKKTISVEGCLTQVFFVFFSSGTEAFLLSVMAYDRYAAICHPLLYGQVMSSQLCVRLVLASWGLASLNALVIVLLAVNLDFCEIRTINHYTCELPALFPLSCSDISITTNILLLSSTLLHGLGTFLPILFSYTRIISTILSISSTSGRTKAFSTCSSHLIAVILFFGSGFLCYLMPPSGSSLDLLISLQYSAVTPLLNLHLQPKEPRGEGGCEKDTGETSLSSDEDTVTKTVPSHFSTSFRFLPHMVSHNLEEKFQSLSEQSLPIILRLYVLLDLGSLFGKSVLCWLEENVKTISHKTDR